MEIRRRRSLALALSLLVHSVLILGIARHAYRDGTEVSSRTWRLEITESLSKSHKSGKSALDPTLKHGPRRNPIDLRPGFMRGEARTVPAPTVGKVSSDSADLLAGDLKTADLFDRLADKVGFALDYPDVLVEKGIEGSASVDLFFDSEGRVDEARSLILGDRRSIRGALVRAMRNGLVSWYKSDAAGLKREQFRNQHFRADFTLSYTLPGEENQEKTSLGNYHFLRRKQISVCLYPGAIDLACAAMKVAGFVKKHTSDKYNVHAAAVIDVLESFDDRGLQGINEEINPSA